MGAKLIQGINDLETWCYQNNNLKLLKEWNYNKNDFFPSQIHHGSGQKVWWICSKGHSWEKTVSERTLRNIGCPYCAGQRVWVGFNDLRTTNPKLMVEWDFNKNSVRPEEVSMGSGQKVWWVCKNGHSYEKRINNKVRGIGCPYCSNQKVIKGENDLATRFPELLIEWDYDKNIISPTEIFPFSNKKYWWKCSKGHSWDEAPNSRISSKSSCPICSNHRVLSGYNDLKTKYPQLMKEWDFDKNIVKPENLIPGTKEKVWWKCEKGHSYQMRASHKISGIGCPYCWGRYTTKGDNDLVTTNPEIIKEWDFEKNTISPYEVSAGSGKKVWWKCDKGHSWKAVISSRVSIGNGCPICSQGLRTSFPEQAIYYYVHKKYIDAINGWRLDNQELDIYIPSLKVGIEYDGGEWHKDLERDKKKNKFFQEKGIFIYRIREFRCPKMIDDKNVKVINITKSGNRHSQAFIDALYELFGYLNIDLEIDLKKDKDEIYKQYK